MRVIRIQSIGARPGEQQTVQPSGERCPVTMKFCFDTEDEALLQSWSWSSQNRYKNGRAYQCEHSICRKWHLTSRP